MVWGVLLPIFTLLYECVTWMNVLLGYIPTSNHSIFVLTAEDDGTNNIRDLMPWVKSKLLSERKMSDRCVHFRNPLSIFLIVVYHQTK